MGRCLIKIKDQYLEWSTVVDAPVTYGMTLEELHIFIKEEYGNSGLVELPQRMERIEKNGTSSNMRISLESLISDNRAGPNETCLSLDEIYERYCVKREG